MPSSSELLSSHRLGFFGASVDGVCFSQSNNLRFGSLAVGEVAGGFNAVRSGSVVIETGGWSVSIAANGSCGRERDLKPIQRPEGEVVEMVLLKKKEREGEEQKQDLVQIPLCATNFQRDSLPFTH